MTTKLEMNRDTAEKIQQRFNVRVATVNNANRCAIGVDLADDVFKCNGFKVFLHTTGKNPENCVHAIVVDILGVTMSVKNPKGVCIGKEFVIFEDVKGSGVIFDIATGPKNE